MHLEYLQNPHCKIYQVIHYVTNTKGNYFRLFRNKLQHLIYLIETTIAMNDILINVKPYSWAIML